MKEDAEVASKSRRGSFIDGDGDGASPNLKTLRPGGTAEGERASHELSRDGAKTLKLTKTTRAEPLNG